jgi:hypothetical protein
MTSRAQELLREALTLPIAERADVAAELLASLDAAQQITRLTSKLRGHLKSSDEPAV